MLVSWQVAAIFRRLHTTNWRRCCTTTGKSTLLTYLSKNIEGSLSRRKVSGEVSVQLDFPRCPTFELTEHHTYSILHNENYPIRIILIDQHGIEKLGDVISQFTDISSMYASTTLVIATKCDEYDISLSIDSIESWIISHIGPDASFIQVSAVDGQGMDMLQLILADMVQSYKDAGNTPIASSSPPAHHRPTLAMSGSASPADLAAPAPLDHAALRVAAAAAEYQQQARAQLPTGPYLDDTPASTPTRAATESPPASPLLEIDIRTSSGQVGVLTLYRGDDPVQVAATFGQRHHLPQAKVSKLEQLLADRLAQAEDLVADEDTPYSSPERAAGVPAPASRRHNGVRQAGQEGRTAPSAAANSRRPPPAASRAPHQPSPTQQKTGQHAAPQPAGSAAHTPASSRSGASSRRLPRSSNSSAKPATRVLHELDRELETILPLASIPPVRREKRVGSATVTCRGKQLALEVKLGTKPSVIITEFAKQHRLSAAVVHQVTEVIMSRLRVARAREARRLKEAAANRRAAPPPRVATLSTQPKPAQPAVQQPRSKPKRPAQRRALARSAGGQPHFMAATASSIAHTSKASTHGSAGSATGPLDDNSNAAQAAKRAAPARHVIASAPPSTVRGTPSWPSMHSAADSRPARVLPSSSMLLQDGGPLMLRDLPGHSALAAAQAELARASQGPATPSSQSARSFIAPGAGISFPQHAMLSTLTASDARTVVLPVAVPLDVLAQAMQSRGSPSPRTRTLIESKHASHSAISSSSSEDVDTDDYELFTVVRAPNVRWGAEGDDSSSESSSDVGRDDGDSSVSRARHRRRAGAQGSRKAQDTGLGTPDMTAAQRQLWYATLRGPGPRAAPGQALCMSALSVASSDASEEEQQPSQPLQAQAPAPTSSSIGPPGLPQFLPQQSTASTSSVDGAGQLGHAAEDVEAAEPAGPPEHPGEQAPSIASSSSLSKLSDGSS